MSHAAAASPRAFSAVRGSDAPGPEIVRARAQPRPDGREASCTRPAPRGAPAGVRSQAATAAPAGPAATAPEEYEARSGWEIRTGAPQVAAPATGASARAVAPTGTARASARGTLRMGRDVTSRAAPARRRRARAQ
ncbi:MAG TPA: hypothetical protein VM844_02050 [Miltoncostaeaceae bacterium]|nr:hypothetical protein [Miltoncostaeaceae bacterium]